MGFRRNSQTIPEANFGNSLIDLEVVIRRVPLGDNLDALKALLPFCAGRVKCIFIDPPYNTRSAFEHYDDNLEHTQWLAMMYPRLELLRELLAQDGSIWIEDWRGIPKVEPTFVLRMAILFAQEVTLGMHSFVNVVE